MVPPFTHFVTAVTAASDASVHLGKQRVKNQAADARGYFVATRSGLPTQSSPIALLNAV